MHRLPLALTAFAVLLAPVATAGAPSVAYAAQVTMDSSAWDGTAELATFLDAPGQNAMSVEINAASLDIQVLRDDGHHVAATQDVLPTTARLARSFGATNPNDQAWHVDGGATHLHAAGAAQVNLLGVMDVAGGGNIQVTRILEPRLGAFGLAPAAPENLALPGLEDEGSDDAYWTAGDKGGAWVRLDGIQGNYHLTGDFVLEVTGMTGMVTGGGQPRYLDAANGERTIAPGVVEDSVGFARLTLLDATVIVHLPGNGHAALASQAVDATGTNVALQDATGNVRSGAQFVYLSGSDYVLQGRQRIGFGAEEAGVQFHAQAVDANGQPLATDARAYAPVANLFGATLGAAVVLVVGAIATILLARRLRRLPTMPDVEAALEAGRFRRAAREALSILRRTPENEDAFVSRAVAMNKHGRHARVVREVRAHMANREPTDGVLHYVLSLSLRALGRVTEADQVLAEAGRRTPSLIAKGDATAPPASPVANVALGGYA